ncbi:hypothetical protein [Sphingomonas aerophila]|uniref:Uncharacterized protein n=1 Tax=Sphingomonas aerophila TaxID=1344948 RepID=A0A7W9BGM7_9SPHN|nr:hypothetical protein [Sphingomonas aerophila]MBB5716516.1 hypothetical protein [Sphingomonas aerophila]
MTDDDVLALERELATMADDDVRRAYRDAEGMPDRDVADLLAGECERRGIEL